jgi:hypothetical protein
MLVRKKRKTEGTKTKKKIKKKKETKKGCPLMTYRRNKDPKQNLRA